MSRMMDILNRRAKLSDEKDRAIQDELVRAFFAKSGKKSKKKKQNPKVKWPVMAATALLLIGLLVVFINNFDVSVSIKSKASPSTEKALREKLNIPPEEDIFFIRSGNPNKYLVRDMVFLGDALKFSREKKDALVLVNSKGSGWANFSLELKEPLNLSRDDISYIAKGQTGDEYIVLAFIDADNRVYRMGRDLSSALTKKWEEHVINLAPVRGAIDITNIKVIKFEFGILTTGNYPSATIFLKDINLTKKQEV